MKMTIESPVLFDGEPTYQTVNAINCKAQEYEKKIADLETSLTELTEANKKLSEALMVEGAKKEPLEDIIELRKSVEGYLEADTYSVVFEGEKQPRTVFGYALWDRTVKYIYELEEANARLSEEKNNVGPN